MPAARRVAVEQRREDLQRDRRGKETRIGRQRRDDAIAELARDLAVRRQLLVALDHCRLRARGGTAVFPFAGVHDAAEIRYILLAQDTLYARQHGTSLLLPQYRAETTR